MEVRFSLHSAQFQVFRSAARFKLVVCGRRWGKTYLGAVAAITQAAQGKRVWWVAPTHSIGLEGFRAVLDALQSLVQKGLVEVKRSAQRQVVFPNGGEIEWRTAGEARSLRGAGLDYVVLDEAAFVNPEIWEMALLPALADRRGGALLLSTPSGKANWLYKLWHLAGEREDWERWKMPSWTNSAVFRGEDDPEIQTLKGLMTPEEFAQEIAAEFLDNDPGAVFRGWSQCLGAQLREPYPGLFVFGVDLARKQDYTVIVVLDAKSREVVALERFQAPWEETIQRVLSLYEAWKPARVLVDATGVGDPVVERLSRLIPSVEGVVITPRKRQLLLEGLRVALQEREVKIPEHQVLAQELDAFRIDITPAGAIRYVSRAEHDDTVFALALAVEGLKRLSLGPSLPRAVLTRSEVLGYED